MADLEELKQAVVSKVEEYTARLREEIVKIFEAYRLQQEAAWHTIASPKPVNPRDRAVRWLRRRLVEIQEKHPELCFYFLTNEAGWITGLRFTASDEEVYADVEAPTRWTFEKASQRPIEAERPQARKT